MMAGQVLGQDTFLTLDDGARVFLDERGEGQTLVFIPGWTMTHRFFENQKEHFSNSHHVLTYDPRGQGRSDQTTFKNTYQDHANDLKQILQQKNLSNIVLIGWSSGCLKVYEYVRQFGFEGIDKVVLIDEPPKWIGDTNREWVYGNFDDYRSSIKDLISGPSEPDGIIDWMLNDSVDSATRKWMREEMLMSSPHVALSLYADGLVSDYRDELMKLGQEVPTLIMVRSDWFDRVKSWLDTNAPGIQATSITSHAMFWERPKEFNEMLTLFLKGSNQSDHGRILPDTGKLLFPRYGPTAVTDGQWIYVYGGAPNGGRNGADFMHHGLHASIERVNPMTLISEFYGSGLHRRANHATVILNGGHVVTCGGRSQIGVSRPKMVSCEFLDLKTGLYREMAPLPEAVRTLGMVEVNGDLYTIGGVLGGGRYSKSTYRLSAGANAWVRLPDAPIPVSGQAIALGDEIYVIGGYNGEAMRSVMVFNTRTLQWQKKSELPYPLSAYSSVTDGKFIFVFGDYKRMDTVHLYDPAEGKLYLLDEKITPRRHTASVLVDGKVIIIGGNQTSSGNALAIMESFQLSDLQRAGAKMMKNDD